MFPFSSNSSSNNSSRNPTPRRGPPQQASGSTTTPRIPPAAYELLHKKYDRPKSQVEMMKLREKIQKQEQEEKRQQRLLRQEEKTRRDRNHQDQYVGNRKSGQSISDDYDENEPLQLRAEDGSILKKATPRNHTGSNYQNENKTINRNNITNLPGSAIQRLPFKSFDDILMSSDENADENGKNSSNNKTDDKIIDATSLYQNSALSYQEMMKKFRSQRSHIHRTWEAVDAEQAHERRSRAIKRSFTTCQMTPAWDPNEAAKKQKKKQQQKLALDQENNNNSRSGSSSNSSTPAGKHDKNKPFSILPADDDDDDNDSYSDRLSPVLSPFSSRILRYEMQHATVSSPNATRKQQQDQEERDNNNNDNRKRRMYREIDSRFPQQQYMEERARAKFMAEVMKRRELENLEDTLDVASQLREKDRQKQLELEAERDRNNQIRNAMEQEGIPPGMKRNRKGDLVPKKYKLVSAKSSKSQGISIRPAGEDIVGLLSPVGVMAKALGHQHHQVYDPSEEFDDDDDDDENNKKEKWVTDSDDDDDKTDMLLSDPFWKRQQKLQKLINPDEEPEENVDEAGQKLWTFDGYEKKKDPSSQNNNKNRFVPKNPTEMQLDEEDAEHEAARAKVKLASLFQRDPPAELLDEIKKPPPSQRRKKEIDDEMMENPDSNGNNQRSQKGKTANPNLTKTRKRGDDQDDDFMNGNFEFIDPNFNDDEDDNTSNQNDANRRRRAAAWRRAKAAMNDGMSDIARELAMKYWNMRMNYVDQDVEKFHHNNNNNYGIQQQQSTNVNNSSFASSSGSAGVHQDLLPSSSVSFSSPTLLRQESLLNSKSFSAEFHRHQQHQQPLLSSTSQSTAPSSPSASFIFRQKVTNTINAADEMIPDVAADENSPTSSVVFFSFSCRP